MEAKKVFSKVGASYMIGYAIYFVIYIALYFIVNAVKPSILETGTVVLAANFILLFGVGYPIMIYLLKKIPAEQTPKNSMGFMKLIGSICTSYFVMIVLALVGAELISLIGSDNANPLANVLGEMNPVMTMIIVGILAPIYEEVLFRKLLIDRLRPYGEGLAIFMSGFMFGLFHGNLMQMIYAMGIGFIMAYIYVRTGKIGYTIAIHIFVNSFNSLLRIVLTEYAGFDKALEYLNEGDTTAYMEYIYGNPTLLAALGIVGFGVIVIMIIGLVFLCVQACKVHFEQTEKQLEKGKKLSTALFNPGIAVFVIFFVVNIILSLLNISIL
ncbi:MAG: CPBP family intramembrane metalloprotease [Lachnospiraceae bacterium]|nr:CPBP family intramembrane metalloprotease [Lachnospiraceae bacterium]